MKRSKHSLMLEAKYKKMRVGYLYIEKMVKGKHRGYKKSS